MNYLDKKIELLSKQIEDDQKDKEILLRYLSAVEDRLNKLEGKFEKGEFDKEVHPDFHFELKSGERLSSIYGLISALKSMNEEIFTHHVSENHNDFANWIKNTLKLHDLAEKIDSVKDRTKIVTVIEKFIDYSESF